ncbi:hypothetical protein LC048_13700 [Mesobacillus subterraneus]|uniref:hypothetical protein n=1 Tax=Mesobacillus subterraneus TaxID=285983 RepID=UPI001CFEC839|nr:hypothetical protein [Mesobacillus subterraneus]WLR53577.1 hypothetical protein LC048_13700 [Mesobacillus subterraneus]
MIVKTIHGAGSHVESFEGNMVISNCNVIVEENMAEQLKDIKMISSIIKLNDKTIYTNEKGEIAKIVETKSKKEKDEDFYKNEGISIFVKGQMMIGIHPDNLESNTIALNNGDLKIDWELLLSRANGTEKVEADWWEKELNKYAKSIISVRKDR